jgi:hypothetical protein
MSYLTMTKIKIAAIVLVVASGLASTGQLQNLSAGLLNTLVPPAMSRVGRPLTPVSVAGVGRRTVRRCAVGVYDC